MRRRITSSHSISSLSLVFFRVYRDNFILSVISCVSQVQCQQSLLRHNEMSSNMSKFHPKNASTTEIFLFSEKHTFLSMPLTSLEILSTKSRLDSTLPLSLSGKVNKSGKSSESLSGGSFGTLQLLFSRCSRLSNIHALTLFSGSIKNLYIQVLLLHQLSSSVAVCSIFRSASSEIFSRHIIVANN